MKHSFLISMIISTVAYTGSLNAQTFDFPVSVGECLSTASDQLSVDRCYGLQNCADNFSGGDQVLQECIFNVETAYSQATGSLPSPGLGGGSAVGTETVTDVANSAYDTPERDTGWKFSQQGGD